jgi:hypothetical protein
MQRIVHKTSLHWIIVNVFQLLPQDFIVFDQLRMASFLPKLKFLIQFMVKFIKFQVSKDIFGISGFQQIDDFSSRERFEPLYGAGEVICRRDEMQMVIQDDVTEKVKTVILLEVFPRIKHDIDGFGMREDRRPNDGGAGEKVGIGVIVDFIASAAHLGALARRSLADSAFPGGSLGTR